VGALRARTCGCDGTSGAWIRESEGGEKNMM